MSTEGVPPKGAEPTPGPGGLTSAPEPTSASGTASSRLRAVHASAITPTRSSCNQCYVASRNRLDNDNARKEPWDECNANTKTGLAVGAAGGSCDRKRFELPAPLNTEWRLSSDRKRDAKALDVRRRDEYALPTYVALVCLAPSRALWTRRSHQDRRHAARILPRSARCYQRTGTTTRPARLLTGTTTASTGDSDTLHSCSCNLYIALYPDRIVRSEEFMPGKQAGGRGRFAVRVRPKAGPPFGCETTLPSSV